MRSRWTEALLALAAAAALACPGVAHPATFNVKDYGATGNGSAIDSPAIDDAIAAASAAGGGIVDFPPGTYLSRTIHLRSNVTINLHARSTILASNSGMDAPEPNPHSQYQDFGHSHFRNALLWGEDVENVAFTGTGTIDGNDNLRTSNEVPAGMADKMLSLKSCRNVSLSDITMRRGGHLAILANGCNGMKLSGVRIFTKGDRDGINFVNSSNVEVANSIVESHNDALAFKSDYALGRTWLSENNVVRDTTLDSARKSAVQFGSETCGSFRNIHFRNLNITGAGDAGISLVSLDGAVIEDITFTDIKLSGTASPIFLHIGKRSRCPGNPRTGRIRNVTFRNVTGTSLIAPKNKAGNRAHTSTIAGHADAPIENITFDNVKLTVPGGHPESDAAIHPPMSERTDKPDVFGVRPSFGFWIRHARSIRFVNSEFLSDRPDGRPGVVASDVTDLTLDGVKLQRSAGSFDIVSDKTSSPPVTNDSTAGSQSLRVRSR